MAEAARDNIAWGFELAFELQKRGEWNSIFWGSLFRAWEPWPTDEEHCKQVVYWLSREELSAFHSFAISRMLLRLVTEGDNPCLPSVLEKANPSQDWDFSL